MKSLPMVDRPFEPLNNYLRFNKQLIYFLGQEQVKSSTNLLDPSTEQNALPSMNRINFTNTSLEIDSVLKEDAVINDGEFILDILYPCSKSHSMLTVALHDEGPEVFQSALRNCLCRNLRADQRQERPRRKHQGLPLAVLQRYAELTARNQPLHAGEAAVWQQLHSPAGTLA